MVRHWSGKEFSQSVHDAAFLAIEGDAKIKEVFETCRSIVGSFNRKPTKKKLFAKMQKEMFGNAVKPRQLLQVKYVSHMTNVERINLYICFVTLGS